MGHKTPAPTKSKLHILEGFLSELLRQEVVIKSIPESETNKANADSKYNKFDLLCENEHGELLAIELQFYPEVDYLRRMLFGTSKLITDYLTEGSPYEHVKKVYSINIVYFDLGQGTDYVYYGRTTFHGLHHNDLLNLSSTQQKKLQKEYIHQLYPEYYIIKVNNFGDVAKDSLDEWIYYLKNNQLPERYTAKGLDKVEAQLKIDAMKTEEKAEYRDYMKNLIVTKSMIETVRLESEAKGEAKGEARGKLEERTEANREFTINLITNTDFDDAKIAQLVGVGEAWVAEIRKSLEQ